MEMVSTDYLCTQGGRKEFCLFVWRFCGEAFRSIVSFVIQLSLGGKASTCC